MTMFEAKANHNSAYTLRFYLEDSAPDTAGNYSFVKAKVTLITTGATFSGWKVDRYVSINGNAVVNDSVTFALMEKNKEKEVWSGIVKVNHNADGSKTINVRAFVKTATTQTYLPGTADTGTKSFALDKIDRIGIIDSFSGNFADGFSVAWTNYNDAYSHRLKVSHVSDGTEYRLFYVDEIAENINFDLSSYVESIKQRTTHSNSVDIKATIETWNGTATAGGTPDIGSSSRSVTLQIGTAPIITNYSVREVNLSEDITVKDMSQKRILLNVSVDDYVSVDSVIVSTGTAQTALNKVSDGVYQGNLVGMTASTDTISYRVTVTDSRGYTATQIHTESYYEYSAPSVEGCTFERAPNPNGTDPTTTNTADAIGRIKFKINYTPILQNSVTATSSGDLGTHSVTGGTDGVYEGILDLPNADYRQSVTVSVTFTDALGGRITVSGLNVPRAIPNMVMFDDEINMNVPLWIEGCAIPSVIEGTDYVLYRYPSGFQKLIYHKAISNKAMTSQWKSGSPVYFGGIGRYTLPVEFTKVTDFRAHVVNASYTCEVMLKEGSAATVTQTQELYAYTFDSKTANIIVCYEIEGLWK